MEGCVGKAAMSPASLGHGLGQTLQGHCLRPSEAEHLSDHPGKGFSPWSARCFGIYGSRAFLERPILALMGDVLSRGRSLGEDVGAQAQRCH